MMVITAQQLSEMLKPFIPSLKITKNKVFSKNFTKKPKNSFKVKFLYFLDFSLSFLIQKLIPLSIDKEMKLSN
jgi:hypothetical protein